MSELSEFVGARAQGFDFTVFSGFPLELLLRFDNLTSKERKVMRVELLCQRILAHPRRLEVVQQRALQTSFGREIFASLNALSRLY